jgi:lipid A 3-O-deacylase
MTTICPRLCNVLKVVALATLLPAVSCAEPLDPWLREGTGEADRLRIAIADDTRTIMTRAEERQQHSSRGMVPLRSRNGFQSGTWRLGLHTGYAISHGHKVFKGNNPDVDFVPLVAPIGYTVTDVHGPIPIRGSLEIILEPTLLIVTSPRSAVGGGASLLGRYNFVTGSRWVPFFDFGLGLLYWDLKLPEFLGGQFNFTIQGGPGVHYFIDEHWAVSGQVRLHHISNAGMDRPNRSVNSSMYLLGLSYFF